VIGRREKDVLAPLPLFSFLLLRESCVIMFFSLLFFFLSPTSLSTAVDSTVCTTVRSSRNHDAKIDKSTAEDSSKNWFWQAATDSLKTLHRSLRLCRSAICVQGWTTAIRRRYIRRFRWFRVHATARLRNRSFSRRLLKWGGCQVLI
jgi:hypothetical protein